MKDKKKTPAKKVKAGKEKKIKQKQPPKRKNVSQKVPNGRTLQTRDEFFQGQGEYRKPGYEDRGMYRRVVVVDSNRSDELAVIKLTTSKKAKELSEYQKGKSRYKPYIETKDNENKPIKIGKKFLPNKTKKDISKKTVNQMKKKAVQKKRNQKLLQKLKGRKK